jgi:hypothetical protein
MLEIWVPTRGGDEAGERLFLSLMPVLAQTPEVRLGLVCHRPLPAQVTAAFDRVCDLTVALDAPYSVGVARAWALEKARGDRICMMDDDCVVLPWSGPARLVDRIESSGWPWANPIIRFTSNLVMPLPDHTETWVPVHRDDPLVMRALDRYGAGWIRTFDTGNRWNYTDQLGGTCFAIDRDRVPGWALDRLREWPEHTGDEDTFLGRALGQGVVYNDVIAYHVGAWTPGDWQTASEELMCLEPKVTAGGREPSQPN